MNHWKTQDQDNSIIEMNYEDLVKKESETSEKLWKFLGIPGKFFLCYLFETSLL